jgi:lysozyme
MSAPFADISSYQWGADLVRYADAVGSDRILIKATEGTGYTNPHFIGWKVTAGLLRLKVGAYHFAKPSRSTGRAEADWFADALARSGGVAWPCLDAEDPDERGHRAALHAVDFCNRMVERGYSRGVIYSGEWYLTPIGLTAAMLPLGWRNLHLATYNAAVQDDQMKLPPGWSRDQVVARQYTSSADVPGMPTRVDMNRVLRDWLSGGDEMGYADDQTSRISAPGFLAGDFKGIVAEELKVARAVFNLLNGEEPNTVRSMLGMVGVAVSQARDAATNAQNAARDAVSLLENQGGGLVLDYDQLAAALLRHIAAAG